MTNSVEMTPVQNKLDCSAPECKKKFVSQQNMEKYKEKFHKIVSALTQSPLANSVRTLFRGDSVDGSMLPSTQGGSDGSVNSPKVVTHGTFQCNQCPEEYNSKEDLKIHITEDHNKAQAAPTSDRDKSAQIEDVLHNQAVVQTEEILQIENLVTVDKIVDSFIDIAFSHINPDIVTPKPPCHECNMKDQVVAAFDKLINEKEYIIVEKSATIAGLGQRVKTLSADKLTLTKKVELTDKLKGDINTKDKEISALKVQIETKDKLLAFAKETGQQKSSNDEIILEAMFKSCKKCKFTAPDMTLLGLHMENDHQYQFECSECTTKFPF